MSVHLYCMYLFFLFLETPLQLICRNEDTHLNSSPPASSYSFTSSHLTSPQFPEKVTVSANNNVQAKTPDFVQPSTSY